MGVDPSEGASNDADPLAASVEEMTDELRARLCAFGIDGRYVVAVWVVADQDGWKVSIEERLDPWLTGEHRSDDCAFDDSIAQHAIERVAWFVVLEVQHEAVVACSYGVGNGAHQLGGIDAGTQIGGTGDECEYRHEDTPVTGSSDLVGRWLIAAGYSGLSEEQLAQKFWSGTRPPLWEGSLRAAAHRLDGRLPDDWDVLITVIDSQVHYSISIPTAWADIWQVEDGGIELSPFLEELKATYQGLRPSHVQSPENTDEMITYLIEGATGAARDRFGERSQATRQDGATFVVAGLSGKAELLLPYEIGLPSVRDELQSRTPIGQTELVPILWRAIIRQAESTTSQVSINFVDAHLLDDIAMQLTLALVNFQRPPNLTLVISGVRDAQNRLWQQLMDAASREASHIRQQDNYGWPS